MTQDEILNLALVGAIRERDDARAELERTKQELADTTSDKDEYLSNLSLTSQFLFGAKQCEFLHHALRQCSDILTECRTVGSGTLAQEIWNNFRIHPEAIDWLNGGQFTEDLHDILGQAVETAEESLRDRYADPTRPDPYEEVN